MHTIKITPNLLFEYQCTSGKFIRLPNRIESNRNFFARIGMLYCADGRRIRGPVAPRRGGVDIMSAVSLQSLIPSAPRRQRSITMSVSVCLSAFVSVPVRDHTFGNTRPIITSFLCMSSMAVARSSSGGVLIRQSSCTSGFMDDVIFAHHRPAAAVDRHERQTDGRTDGHQTVELRYTSPFTA